MRALWLVFIFLVGCAGVPHPRDEISPFVDVIIDCPYDSSNCQITNKQALNEKSKVH
jgi:hypothetical protein